MGKSPVAIAVEQSCIRREDDWSEIWSAHCYEEGALWQ